MCSNEPIILTGDFNVYQTHSSYKLLNTSGSLFDSYENANVRYAFNGMFNAFSADRVTNSRVDHIFVTPNLNVDRYGILTDTYRTVLKDGDVIESTDFSAEYTFKGCDIKLPSDYFPVVIKRSHNND